MSDDKRRRGTGEVDDLEFEREFRSRVVNNADPYSGSTTVRAALPMTIEEREFNKAQLNEAQLRAKVSELRERDRIVDSDGGFTTVGLDLLETHLKANLGPPRDPPQGQLRAGPSQVADAPRPLLASMSYPSAPVTLTEEVVHRDLAIAHKDRQIEMLKLELAEALALLNEAQEELGAERRARSSLQKILALKYATLPPDHVIVVWIPDHVPSRIIKSIENYFQHAGVTNRVVAIAAGFEISSVPDPEA